MHTVNLPMSAACRSAHPEVCVFCQLLSPAAFCFFLPAHFLLVNRHISIFISRLPQPTSSPMSPSKFFFFLLFTYLSMLLYSVLELVSCTKKVTWPQMSYKYMIGTRQKNPLYHYYYYQQATVERTCTHSVMHYARNGYFNKLIEPSE